MKLISLFVAALLACSAAQKEPQLNNEDQIIKISSHEQFNLEELLDMADVARTKNLRGSIDVHDLTDCAPDFTPKPKYKKFREVSKETVQILYTYIPDNDDEN